MVKQMIRHGNSSLPRDICRSCLRQISHMSTCCWSIADRRHGLANSGVRMFLCELVQVTNTQRQSHPLGNHTRNLGRNLCTEQVAGTRELRLQRWQGGALQNSERPAFLYQILHADQAEPRDNPVPRQMKLLMPCVLAAICECHNGKR